MSKSKKSSSGSKKTIEDKYKKATQHEHVLMRPGMYIGSVKKSTGKMWIANSSKDKSDPKIILKEITYVPGFYKIVDEIYVNARDRTVCKLKIPCTIIKITIDKKSGRITVWNNGDGIDVAKHKEHKVWVPTLIFSELLTSTNFDDDKGKNQGEKRTTGGMNGIGAKATNIYSREFEIETLDVKKGLKFYQKFSDNMFTKEDPIIEEVNDAEPYTQVSFIPDFAKFGIKSITPDMFNLLKRRAYDLAMNTNAKVYFNDKAIKPNNLQSYVKLFFPEDGDESFPRALDIKSNARWKIAVVFDTTNQLEHENISFVNGISTNIGGTHVDHVVNQIVNRLKDKASKRLKGIMAIKPALIKENLIFFIDSVIEEPEFDSQSKERLKTPAKDFGSEYKLTETFIKAIEKTGIIDSIVSKAESLANASFNKTDGKKTEHIRMDKLCDAEKAGTKESEKCMLFLTEGDSAKTLAMAGFNIIGRKHYGVFPLRGKLKNVAKEAKKINIEKLNENEEVKAIKKIVGLKTGCVYEDLKSLRYGSIVILTDQDDDGYHIKGLLMNFINKFWPSLIKYEGFIQCFPTPIVKASKGTKCKEFYSLPVFENWKSEHEGEKWDFKYYKGLATSTQKEAQGYFKRFVETLNIYYCPDPPKKKSKRSSETEVEDVEEVNCTEGSEAPEAEPTYKPKFKDPTTEAISLAFDGGREDDRKVWMNQHDPTDYLDNSQKRISYPDFINKELRAYAITAVRRAIPNLMDGYKPSQCKIYYVSVLKNLYTSKKEIRVSQLAGAVSELTNYHHGENSLQGAIVKMAQNFVGSNNLNLLFPSGNFGSRLEGGDDAGSARYINTYLDDIGKKIFHPDDFPILHQQIDEGTTIEPLWYVPIIPMLLVNGSSGIGTGWSSTIPPCNPRDIINNIRLMLEGHKPKKMHPWYRNFTGSIEKIENQKYLIRGKYEIIGNDTLHITDLPIGTWTENYKTFIYKLMDEAIKQTKAEKTEKGNKDKKGKKGKGAKATPPPKKGKSGSKAPTKKRGGAKGKGQAKRGKAKKDPNKSRTAKVAKTNTIAKHIKSFVEHCTDNKVDITITFYPGKLQQLLESGKLETDLKLATTIKLSNMNAFDENGRIVKYESYGSIMSNYMRVRLEFYQKRKDYLLDKWRKEMDILEWKLKFVEGVIDGEIIIFKNSKAKSKAEVHARLEELEFPKFYDGQSKKTSYSYTDMSWHKLTREEVEKLRRDVADKKKDIRELEGKSPEQLYTIDLDDFVQAYDIWEAEADEEYQLLLNDEGGEKKSKKKKKTKQVEAIEI
jgi:DNA topoisomerase-2